MPRYPSWLFLLAISPAVAPAAPAPENDLAASPVFTAQAAAPAPVPVLKDSHGEKPQIRTADLAKALAGSLPAYAPPVSAPPKPEEWKDGDIPRNHVIRLPKYVVHEGPPPAVRKLTPRELSDLAMKAYVIDPKDMPSFAARVARALFQGYADQQAADAERANGMAELNSEAKDAAVGGDAAESEFIREEANDVYMRHQDWAAPVPTNRPNASTPR